MKSALKKALASLLVIAMVFSLSVNVHAEDEKTTIAVIKDTDYSSLEQAIADAQENDTIQLKGDVELSSTLTIDKDNLTLDLNGHNISKASDFNGDDFFIRNPKNLKITDSSANKNGTISSDSVATIYTTGSLILESGTIKNTKESGTHAVYLTGASSLTVLGGTIDAKNNGVRTAANFSGTVSFDGGKVNANIGVYGEAGTIQMNNGTIVGSSFGFYVKGVQLTINGGEINAKGDGSNDAVRVLGQTKLTVNDGKLTSKNRSSIYVSGVNNELRVNGGTFDEKQSMSVESLTQFIYGGTFNHYVNDNQIVETGKLIDNGNGTFTVGKTVAKVGDNYYLRLADAITVANNNSQDVVLVNDVTESATILTHQEVVLDLNGYTLTNETGKDTITVNGKLTVVDNSVSQTGTVTNTANGKTPLLNNGEAVLNGGKFVRHDVSGNSYYTVVNQGTMKIDGAEISNDNHLASCVENGWYNNEDAVGKSASLTVSSGNITGGLNTIKNDAGGVLNVEGGTITNDYQYAIMNWNKSTIEGGNIICTAKKTTKDYPAAIYNDKFDDTSVGELIINGGNLTTNKDSTYALDNRSKATISGTANLVGGSSAIQVTGKEASIVVNGGTFEGKIYYGIVAKNGSTVEINDGSFKSGSTNYSSPLRFADPGTKATVKGGTFTNIGGTPGTTTAYIGLGTTVIIEGGTFTGSSEYAVNNNGGNLTISGGEFSSPNNSVFVRNNKNAVTTITGGTFTSESENAVLKDGVKGTLNISGGTFSSDVSEYVADENMVVQNGDVYSIVEDLVNVARIGTQRYSTVQAAINAAKNEETVVLIKDTKEDIVIENKNIILDLNGKTLTNESSDTITVHLRAKLTVIGEGTVDNKTNARAVIYNNGEVVLNGGVYDRTSETGDVASDRNSWYTICNHGTMTINENTTVRNSGNFSSMIENGYQSYSSNNARTGYVEGTNSPNPSLTINNGTFNGGLNTVKNDDGGSLTIKGGTYRNTVQAAILNWNEATIQGGDFDCNADYCVLNGTSSSPAPDVSEINKGSLTIQGGTFNSNGTTTIYNNFTTDDIVSVSGGNFNSALKKEYLAEGFTLVPSNNGFGVENRNETNENVFATELNKSQYTDGETPITKGYVFAGWYSDENCENVYTDTAEKAYAKFVDEEVLSVKAQLSADTTSESDKTNIRFVTTVDCLDYQEVGFKITINGGNQKKVQSTQVFKSIKSDSFAGEIEPSLFNDSSQYFAAYTIKNIPNSAFNTEIEIIPYWITNDGTEVDGVGRTLTVNQGIDSSIQPYSFD